MKRSKAIAVGVFFSMLIVANNVTVLASGWEKDSLGYRWEYPDGSFPTAEWIMTDNKIYYFDVDGYMVHDVWVGNYYYGSDGARIINTITPDGHKVGADGTCIQGMEELSVTPYYKYQTNPDIIINGGSSGSGYHGMGYGYIDADKKDVIEHEKYYEIKNQTLSAIQQYDVPQNSDAEYYFLPNGKYGLSEYNGWYESNPIYYGSFYVRKDVKVNYMEWTGSEIIYHTVSLDEYLKIEGHLGAYIMGEDDKGYIVEVTIQQAG